MTSRLLQFLQEQRKLIYAAGLVAGSTCLFQRQTKTYPSSTQNFMSTTSCSQIKEVYPSTQIRNDAVSMRKPSREPRLKSKVSVITGASRGLGQAIAIRFVQEGASVVLLDIADCDETMKIIAKQIGNDTEKVALAIQCDISKEDEVKQSIEKASKTFGPRIDVVVNNACAFVFKSVEDATVEDWTRSMNVNILGHGLVTKHCLPYMKHAIDKEAGFGPSIIFQGSISSFRGQPDCATYATMKGAIVQLARNCAYDLAKYNIRVNTICPGTIESPISIQERKDQGWSYDEWEALKTQDVFLGRVGRVDEVANAALFFASDESSYCSGAHLMVDGGAAACTVMQKNL